MLAGGGHDRLAGLRTARERHHVDARMLDERGAGDGTAAVHQVHDAGRQAGFVEQLHHPQHRQRRMFGGLQHAGIAEGNAGGDAHGGKRERRVPRRDQRADAAGLARHVSQQAAVAGVGLAGDVARDFGEELEIAGRPAELLAHPHDRQAGIDAFEPGELVGVLPQHVANAVEDVLAVVDGQSRPGPAVEGIAGGADRGIDFARVRFLEHPDGLLGRGIDDRQFRRAGPLGDAGAGDDAVHPRREAGAIADIGDGGHSCLAAGA